MDKETLNTIIELAKEVGVLQNSKAELEMYNENIEYKLREARKENDFLHKEIEKLKNKTNAA